MKSKRAEDYIDEYYEYLDDEMRFIVDVGEAQTAVELAEEDMADKAAKAFCAVHCPKGCPFDKSEECNALREFKRKMEE